MGPWPGLPGGIVRRWSHEPALHDILLAALGGMAAGAGLVITVLIIQAIQFRRKN